MTETVAAAEEAVDFIVEDHGTVWRFHPLTPEAAEWVDENVDVPGWAWMGLAFCADHRPAADLLAGIQGEGFRVQGP